MRKLALILLLLPALIFSDDEAVLEHPVVLSVPKAGGHLALKMLSLFPEAPKGRWADHADAACTTLKKDQLVTLDPTKGLVFEGIVESEDEMRKQVCKF